MSIVLIVTKLALFLLLSGTSYLIPSNGGNDTCSLRSNFWSLSYSDLRWDPSVHPGGLESIPAVSQWKGYTLDRLPSLTQSDRLCSPFRIEIRSQFSSFAHKKWIAKIDLSSWKGLYYTGCAVSKHVHHSHFYIVSIHSCLRTWK